MSLEEDVRYLMDRAEIHERIATYALGQDFHQPGWKDQDSYREWSEVFSDDVTFDIGDTGVTEPVSLETYIEMMRGKNSNEGGIEKYFTLWAHLEHPVKIIINGDEATSISLHVHMHETKKSDGNVFLVGYWLDHWKRTSNGWRIDKRRLKQLFVHTFPIAEMSESLLGLESGFRPIEGFDVF